MGRPSEARPIGTLRPGTADGQSISAVREYIRRFCSMRLLISVNGSEASIGRAVIALVGAKMTSKSRLSK